MKRTIAAFGAAAAVALGVVGTAPTASAADGWCSRTVEVTRNGYRAAVPATAGGSTSCVMGRGSSGSQVEALQFALSICNDLYLSSDGSYGPQTEAAVRTVQSRNNLSADGVYGPNTRNATSWRWYPVDWSANNPVCARF
ncbi:peptidoglycan-binding protein [Streptomyces sp. NPDC056480]|uniref:peptidoglycan-binding domain-containing protein n=1 Tax=Streptomyces sp. NPDC056480 TaxID=3345833 RepID=UPI0036A17B0A